MQKYVQPLLRKARRKTNGGRMPWLSGRQLSKGFAPLWRSMDTSMRPPNKGQNFGSWVHFCSCWWSRALSPLALQAEVQAESVYFEKLLARFLTLCRLAQEKGVQVAYEHDEVESESLSSRIEAKDKTV